MTDTHPQAAPPRDSPCHPPGKLVAVPVHDRMSLAHTVGEAAALRAAARDAEDSGDFKGALRLVRRLPADRATGCWAEQLAEAAGLAAAAGAELACWLVNPALRWALERPCGQERLEGYARLMLATLGVPSPKCSDQLAAAVLDPVVADAGLFDGALFDRYLVAALGPSLAARAGPVSRWSQSPASIWELRVHDRKRLGLRDCWSGHDVGCLPWSGSAVLPVGAILYGRLVPVPGDGSWAFALPPSAVDQRCATRVLRARQRGSGPEERIRAVACSRRRAQR